MLRLKTKQEIPPGEYPFVDPDTGYRMKGGSLGETIGLARKHRIANGLDIPNDFDAQVEHFICARLSPQWCSFEDGTSMMPTPDIGIDTIIAGGKAVMRLILAIDKAETWVSTEEAERRAFVCARCALNSRADGCIPCRGIEAAAAVIEAIRGARTTSQDVFLNYCMACGCSLKLIVWVSNDVLDTGTNMQKTEFIQQRAPHCWRLCKI